MDKILTNIAHGWCDFNLGDFEGRPSYIRFLPLDIINGYEEYCKSQHCIIEFDCEMWQFCLVIWENNVIILDNKYNKINTNIININEEELLTELIKEIISDVDIWAKWISTTGTKENIELAKKAIIRRIKEVGIVI